MAKARAIVKRRKAVINIRRITRTMQLIATAQYQKMFNRATATHPYTEKITQLVSQLSQAGEQVDHPLLAVNEGAHRTALIVLTSNRGLCGGYNSSILRASLAHLDQESACERAVEIHAVGKKGVSYLKFLKLELASAEKAMPDWPPFARVEGLAKEMIDAYTARSLDGVYVAYTRFVSAGKQVPTILKLLPIEDTDAGGEESASEGVVEYEFSPPAEELLAELLPSYVKVRLYQCFTDAAVSEQIARMVAMKAATDAAGDMVKTLGQQYNRARQSQITLELLDIVGGAEAVR